jgi:glutaredoxin 3
LSSGAWRLPSSKHFDWLLHCQSWQETIEMALIIYTKPGCPYCQQARESYRKQGIEFTEFDAQNDRERRKEMLIFSDGDPTVPCIVQDGNYMGSGWGIPPRG